MTAHTADDRYVKIAITSSTGEYTLANLSPGTYALDLKAAEDSCRGPLGRIEGVVVVASETTTVSFAAQGGAISGVVEDESHAPIPEATIEAHPGKSYRPVMETTTAPDGSYTLRFLAGGDYVVLVRPTNPGYTVGKRDVTVVAGQETSGQVITVGLAGAVTGTLTNASGEPVAGAFVCAQDPEHLDQTLGGVESDADGNYTVGNLPSGSYWVGVAGAEGYLPVNRTDIAVVAGQTTPGVDFVLQTTGAGGTIAGTVRTADGKTPIPNAPVTAVCQGGSNSVVFTADDGSYSTDSLIPGNYTVAVVASGYALALVQDIPVNLGQTTADIDFLLNAE